MTMKLSICLPYYNAVDYLAGCLRSIAENSPSVEFEVIVVDDASQISPTPAVEEEFPGARVLRNEQNLGFPGTSNVAWNVAQGEYVLFLNTDTEILAGALDELTGYLDEHPEVAAVGPMVLNTDGSFQPQCRRGWLTPLSGLMYSLRMDRVCPHSPVIAQYLLRYTDRETVQPVRALSGCCMLFRRDTLVEHGGFDDRLVQYGEDLDLCYRVGSAGHGIVYDPRARIVHHGGKGGTNVRVVRSLYYFHRSLWLVFFRYRRSGVFFLYAWFVLLMLGVRFVLASGLLVMGRRRAGTRKGAERFLGDRDAAPAREAQTVDPDMKD